MIYLYLALALILIFFSVIFIRTLLFKPKNSIEASNEEVSFDKESKRLINTILGSYFSKKTRKLSHKK